MVRGRKRELEPARKVEADLSASIHNRFDVEVVDARTGEVRQRAQAENVICEQLWTRLLKPDSYFNYIHYGTGEGTPSAADTSLFHFLGGLSIKADDAVTDISYSQSRYSYRQKVQIAENVAVGEVITEVGIAYSSAASSLCTHAMLKDMNGNKISIAKTGTDIINVYATIFVHWPAALVNDGIQIAGLTAARDGFMAYLAGRCEDSYYHYAAAPAYAELVPSRQFKKVDSASSYPICYTQTKCVYNVEKHTIILTATRVPVENGNLKGGSSGIILSSKLSDSADIYLETGHQWFVGSNITGEAIGTGDGATQDFTTGFDYPQNAVIYVDGVVSRDVVVDCVPFRYQEMGMYFNRITIEGGSVYPSINRPVIQEIYIGYVQPGTYENPNWASGVRSFAYQYIQSVAVSDDLIHWDYLFGDATSTKDLSGSCEIPEELKNKRYWEIRGRELNGNFCINELLSDTLTGFNIHFPTPPPAGAVITADYTTKCIAKDANHVFDLTVTIHLGEYQA